MYYTHSYCLHLLYKLSSFTVSVSANNYASWNVLYYTYKVLCLFLTKRKHVCKAVSHHTYKNPTSPNTALQYPKVRKKLKMHYSLIKYGHVVHSTEWRVSHIVLEGVLEIFINRPLVSNYVIVFHG